VRREMVFPLSLTEADQLLEALTVWRSRRAQVSPSDPAPEGQSRGVDARAVRVAASRRCRTLGTGGYSNDTKRWGARTDDELWQGGRAPDGRRASG
jgi:hypothetical protein